MSGLNLSAFTQAVRPGGQLMIGSSTDGKELTVFSAKKSFGSKALDWLAGNVMKNTTWGSGRLSQMETKQKVAFNLLVAALKNEYGVKENRKGRLDDQHNLEVTKLKSNIEKAIRESFGGKVPKLTAKNVAKMESVAKNFRGMGDAKSLKRNLVVRWWVSGGLTHPGHAAAGIRNRVADDKAADKYVSFWPEKGAGGLGEILRSKAQAGSLSMSHKNDYQSELGDRTVDRLERGRIAGNEHKLISGRADTLFSDLRKIDGDTPKQAAFLMLNEAIDKMTDGMVVDTDFEGNALKDQSTLQGDMKLKMDSLLDGFIAGKVSLDDCKSGLKSAANDLLSELAGMAKYQPRARQERFDSGGEMSWGLKAEKFYLPLTGHNESIDDEATFSYFGLDETKMASRQNELALFDAETTILDLTNEELKKDYQGEFNGKLGYLERWSNDLLKNAVPGSDYHTKLQERIGREQFDQGGLKTLKGYQNLVDDLKKIINEKGHGQLDYKMVSKSDNCAGYITDLMELGGGLAFAPKPKVMVATSPNDTAKWAKEMLVEVDRLNKLASTIMAGAEKNYDLDAEEIKEVSPDNVYNAYKAVKDLGDATEPVGHEVLMQKVKTLVQELTADKTLSDRDKAAILQDIQSVYK